jgi:hypothetical protein
MEKLKRGDKIYLDKNQVEESSVNRFLACRDGIVEVYEYRDESGYGSKTRLFYCEDTKHESVSIIRQIYICFEERWVEENMSFDSDSFKFLEAIINGEKDEFGGKYSLVRDYSLETNK